VYCIVQYSIALTVLHLQHSTVQYIIIHHSTLIILQYNSEEYKNIQNL